jgi:hypothetical protein
MKGKNITNDEQFFAKHVMKNVFAEVAKSE